MGWIGKSGPISREQAVALLRECEPELKARGVLSASIFGSVARDDAGPDSDLDIAVRLGSNFSSGGFDAFYQLEQLRKHLSKRFGCKVDVLVEPIRKERLRKEVEKDRALAF